MDFLEGGISLANYDGKVIIGTALDNSGIARDAQRAGTSLRSQAAKLAAEYRKQGMSMSDAMKRAWSEIERSGKETTQRVGADLKGNIGGSAGVVVGKLGGLASVLASITAGITAAFGAAAVAITKQAVDAYADYEQLAGGVETLFKGSADKVKQYANDAFFTVGVSANEYMSMVTGFSASLISSLGGNTEKAADVANMALVDMADNANKMGSALESVQAAYQGFSKGQYQLLDNLKLGYGGTKTEMERLLADAQKLTGVKYNINNLADVYSAIHAIQEKLGIAGTTAREAERTITGSAAMTKAAWKNVLTAIAGGGDLDRAINNLVYSVSKYFENIVPVVERSLAGIGQLIEKIAPQLVQTIAASLIRAIPSLLNAVYQMVLGLAQGVAQGIKALFTGGEIKPVSKQLENVSEGFENAAEGANALADATEDAGKAAKKSLAGFDEITKLSSASGGSGDSGGGTTGSIGAISAGAISVNAESVQDNVSPVISAIADNIRGYIEPLRDIDFAPALESIQSFGGAAAALGESVFNALEWVWFNILTPLADWTIEDAAPAAIDTFTEAFRFLGEVLKPVGSGLADLWEECNPLFGFLGDTAVSIIQNIGGLFSDLATTFEDNGGKIEKIFSDLAAIIMYFWDTGFEPWLDDMVSGTEGAFSELGELLSLHISGFLDACGGLTEFLAGVFTGDWKKAWEGLGNAVKGPVNLIIGFLNKLISSVVTSINSMVEAINKLSLKVPDWVPGIGGSTIGFSLKTITAPQIPYLAKGAVLPANKPFLAMVGDQKHGTNIEAPLSTIQEAVALVMEDFASANMAGQETIIEVLREILGAVLGIEIGDDVIGAAVDRYQRKMHIARGEV